MPKSEQFWLIHKTSQQVVAQVAHTGSVWRKGWGVIGRRALPPGEGLWLPGVATIHTCFVQFPLELLFLDKTFHACAVVLAVRPWCLMVGRPGAAHTVELGAGTLARFMPFLREGDAWELRGITH